MTTSAQAGCTPLPWNVRDHTTGTGGRHIWIEGGPPIGQTRAGPYKRQILEDEDYPEKAADAAIIVSAVNAMPETVAALDMALASHAAGLTLSGEAIEALRRAHKALADVGGLLVMTSPSDGRDAELLALAQRLWAKLCHECYALPGKKCDCIDDILAAFKEALPSPVDNPSRDDLARIIDPEAFECLKRTHIIPSDNEFKRMKLAKKKANAIQAHLANPPDPDSDQRALEDMTLASNVREAVIRECAAKALEMRNAIDMIEGALMRWPELMDLPEKWATHGADRHRRDLGLRDIVGTCGQLYDVYDALAECTRIINSEEYTPAALSPPSPGERKASLNNEAKQHPPLDNPRDAFASPDRLPKGD